MSKKDSKLQWPVMIKQTKLPRESKMAKENKEMLRKIDQWKKQFG